MTSGPNFSPSQTAESFLRSGAAIFRTDPAPNRTNFKLEFPWGNISIANEVGDGQVTTRFSMDSRSRGGFATLLESCDQGAIQPVIEDIAAATALRVLMPEMKELYNRAVGTAVSGKLAHAVEIDFINPRTSIRETGRYFLLEESFGNPVDRDRMILLAGLKSVRQEIRINGLMRLHGWPVRELDKSDRISVSDSGVVSFKDRSFAPMDAMTSLVTGETLCTNVKAGVTLGRNSHLTTWILAIGPALEYFSGTVNVSVKRANDEIRLKGRSSSISRDVPLEWPVGAREEDFLPAQTAASLPAVNPADDTFFYHMRLTNQRFSADEAALLKQAIGTLEESSAGRVCTFLFGRPIAGGEGAGLRSADTIDPKLRDGKSGFLRDLQILCLDEDAVERTAVLTQIGKRLGNAASLFQNRKADFHDRVRLYLDSRLLEAALIHATDERTSAKISDYQRQAVRIAASSPMAREDGETMKELVDFYTSLECLRRVV